MDVTEGLDARNPLPLLPCPINQQGDQVDTQLIPFNKQLLSHIYREAFVSNCRAFIADSVSSPAALVTRESGRKTRSWPVRVRGWLSLYGQAAGDGKPRQTG